MTCAACCLGPAAPVTRDDQRSRAAAGAFAAQPLRTRVMGLRRAAACSMPLQLLQLQEGKPHADMSRRPHTWRRRVRCVAAHLRPGPAAEVAATAAAAATAVAAAAVSESAVDLARWRQDGVLIFPGFFSTEEMRPLAEGVQALMRGVPVPGREAADGGGVLKGKEGEEVPGVVDPWGRGRLGGAPGLYTRKFDTEMVRLDSQLTKRYPEVVAALERHPRLAAVTGAILGAHSVNMEHMCSCYFRGMGHGWHQDTGTDEDLASQMMLNRLIYFQTHSPEQGALYYVPGSIHRGHLTQHGSGGHHDPLPGEVRLVPTAGTLVLLHTRCYHRVGHNRTDTPRLMFNLRVSDGSATPHTPTHSHMLCVVSSPLP